MKPIFFTFGGILLLLFESCCSTVDCSPDSLRPHFISFINSDVDTIIIRRFSQNRSFQNLIDTTPIKSSNSIISHTTGDTLRLDIWDNAEVKLSPGFDYEIYIPATNSSTRIANIVETKSKQKQCFVSDGQGPCFNSIVSFSQNGQLMRNQGLYIKK